MGNRLNQKYFLNVKVIMNTTNMLMVSMAVISITCAYLVYQNIQYLNSLKGLANNISSMNGTISQSISNLSRRLENINVSTQKLNAPAPNKINQLKGQYNNYKLDKLEMQDQKEFSDNSEHQGNSSPVNVDPNDSNLENLAESSSKLQQSFNNNNLFSLESDKDISINDNENEDNNGDNNENDDNNENENDDNNENDDLYNEKSNLLETNEFTEEHNEETHDNGNDSIGDSDDYETDSEMEKNEVNSEKEPLNISQMSDIDINEQTDEDTEVLTDKIKNEIKNLEQLEETVYPSITQNDLERMTVRELKTFAANNSIIQKGTKKELLTRVKEKLNLE